VVATRLLVERVEGEGGVRGGLGVPHHVLAGSGRALVEPLVEDEPPQVGDVLDLLARAPPQPGQGRHRVGAVQAVALLELSDTLVDKLSHPGQGGLLGVGGGHAAASPVCSVVDVGSFCLSAARNLRSALAAVSQTLLFLISTTRPSQAASSASRTSRQPRSLMMRWSSRCQALWRSAASTPGVRVLSQVRKGPSSAPKPRSRAVARGVSDSAPAAVARSVARSPRMVTASSASSTALTAVFPSPLSRSCSSATAMATWSSTTSSITACWLP